MLNGRESGRSVTAQRAETKTGAARPIAAPPPIRSPAPASGCCAPRAWPGASAVEVPGQARDRAHPA